MALGQLKMACYQNPWGIFPNFFSLTKLTVPRGEGFFGMSASFTAICSFAGSLSLFLLLLFSTNSNGKYFARLLSDMSRPQWIFIVGGILLPAFSLHAGFNFELGVPWSKVSDTREKGACVATCCKGLKVQILSPLSLIVTEFFRIPSQSNLSSAPSPSLPFSLDLTTIEHVSSHYQVGDNERREAIGRLTHFLNRISILGLRWKFTWSGGGINLEISHKAPFAAVFNYAIRLAGRDDKSGGYMAGNHILRLRRTSQCRLATTLRANYVTLFAFATSFSP